MAKTTAKIVAIGVITAKILVSAQESVAADEVATVVLHVADHQHVPAGELAAAQRRAAATFAKLRVRLVWTGGSQALAAPDHAWHFDVAILSAAMTHAKRPEADALGEASAGARRASIHYARVLDYAKRTQSDPACVLALALAHEIGHLLLPPNSHTDWGVMRAAFEGRIVTLPEFASPQAATIRARLGTTLGGRQHARVQPPDVTP